jgi:HPt (histidine-containing phosphotransfer) domain-containing protein
MNDFISKPIDKTFLVKIFKKYLISAEIINKKNEIKKQKRSTSLHFNKTKLLKIVGNDKPLIKELFTYAQIQIPKLFDLLDIAIKSKNHTEIKNLAHTIKGTALNMCFEQMINLTRSIEENSDKEIEEIEISYNQLLNEWEVVKKIIS